MFSPLMQQIITREGLPVLSAETLDGFAQDAGDMVLMVGGDWKRHVEVNDLAVILPELLKAAGGQLTGAVLDRASEREIQTRFRFNRYPVLIFLRDGQYLGRIQKVLDWADYIAEINAILARAPSDPPPYEFPDGCAPAQTAN
ncbi:MAG TPA: hydrogenase-1 expression HyaE [Rhodobacteraceae bacterium]|nr:hydrogenase-1 expression HyaE [Paracoccaceae bacterium]